MAVRRSTRRTTRSPKFARRTSRSYRVWAAQQDKHSHLLLETGFKLLTEDGSGILI